MIVGNEVTLSSLGDVIIRRVVVSVENGMLFVCKREEFESAKREVRVPVCIGFRAEYVVDPK
jgi:hypothetical protein